MTKARPSFVAAAVAALSASRGSMALSVPVQPRQNSGGLFGRRSGAQRWMPPGFQSSKLIACRLRSTKEKEMFFTSVGPDDAAKDDEKTWPVKPMPPETSPPSFAATEELPPSETSAAERHGAEMFATLLDPTIAKGVPSEMIQGAAINGAFLTLLASFLLFGPFSVSSLTTLVTAASVGIVTAYISITEGTTGAFVRGVGRVTMEVADMVTGEMIELRGESEVNKVANALLERPEVTSAIPKKGRGAKAARIVAEKKWEEAARLKAEEEARAAAEEAARIEAEERAKVKATEEAARVKAEEEARTDAEARAKVKAAEEAARVKAKEEARIKAEEKARAKAEASMAKEEAKARAKEEARLMAEEEARAKLAKEEAARIKAEQEAKAAAEEEARLAKLVLEEEQRRLEEQAEAARDAVRLMEEQEALLGDLGEDDGDDEYDDEGELDDADWEASVRLANELQGGMPSFAAEGDAMDEIGDVLLRMDIDNLSAEEEDALGKAAREAVRKYEEEMAMKERRKDAASMPEWYDDIGNTPVVDFVNGSEEAVSAPDPAMDYSKMTVVQLKDVLRSKGLKVSGKKAELIERLQAAP